MTIPLLIDADPGIDDAVALALAARLSALRVVTITTVHGNTDIARATRNAREVARRVGLDAPIIAGAAAPLQRPARPARETHGEEGLGHHIPETGPMAEPERAAEMIAAAAGEHDRATLCCLGPLTNLARALATYPHVASGLGPVFVMGGTIAVPGTQTRWSEFNWWADPEAADTVLRAGLDLRLVPLDVTRRIAVPGAAVRALRDLGAIDEGARFWGDLLSFYMDFHRAYEAFDGCVVNDALAIALVADPSLATWREMRLGVSLADDERRGAIVVDAPDGAAARVAMDVRAADVLSIIARNVFSPWLAPGDVAPGAEAAERWLAEHAR